jgi:hypothetical protein
MNYSRTAVKRTWAILSIMLALFALVAADYSKFTEEIITLISPSDIQETYTIIFNYSVRISLYFLPMDI